MLLVRSMTICKSSVAIWLMVTDDCDGRVGATKRCLAPKSSKGSRDPRPSMRAGMPPRPASRPLPVLASAPRRPSLSIEFVHQPRQGQGELARPASPATVAFPSCDTYPWLQTTYAQLVAFVKSQVMINPALGLSHKDWCAIKLLTSPQVGRAPVYLRGESDWLMVKAIWRQNQAVVATIAVETPCLRDMLSRAISNADLGHLQRGTCRRRPQAASNKAVRALNRALADDTDQTANDLVPAMFTVAELLAYVQFKNDLKQVFGTASCHPHPGMFFCWCGARDGFDAAVTIQAKCVGDITAFHKHLAGDGCSWPGKAIARRRLFEFLKYNIIRTPLPPRMPPIIVPSRLMFDFQPNILADGKRHHCECCSVRSPHD